MPAASQRSLVEVIRSLPAACYERDRGKSRLTLLRDLALYGGVIAALFATDRSWLVVPLWLLAALCISGLFILAHDAAHGTLFESERANRIVGRLAMLPSFHLYEAWCFGHNRIHHGHTARGEMDFSWHPLTLQEYRRLSLPQRLRHRLEWSCLGAGVYYLHEVWWRKMVRFRPSERLRSAVRRDHVVVGGWAIVASLSLAALGFASYGTLAGALWTWLEILVVPFLLFGWMMGWTTYVQHVGPDVSWHARKRWSKFKGPMEGTTILHVPRWLNFFFHNILIHVPHHVDSRIPFYHLPLAADQIVRRYPALVQARKCRVSDYLRSTAACKLFDFERGGWTDYRGRAAGTASRGRWRAGSATQTAGAAVPSGHR